MAPERAILLDLTSGDRVVQRAHERSSVPDRRYRWRRDTSIPRDAGFLGSKRRIARWRCGYPARLPGAATRCDADIDPPLTDLDRRSRIARGPGKGVVDRLFGGNDEWDTPQASRMSGRGLHCWLSEPGRCFTRAHAQQYQSVSGCAG